MLFTVFSRLIHYKRKKNISQNFNTTINISIPAINENLITYSMSKNENLRDLNWLTQAIETEALNLNSVSFYLFQPSSNCHQESENSININISKENNFHFSLILIALGTSGKAKSTLENIGFHQVSWELEQIKNLGVLLENGENIKQILDGNWFSAVGVEHLLCPLSRFSSLISINVNGIHVRVELGGQFGYYIDILACSAHNITETLRLIRQLIIPTIQSLCQNIILTESIIRPECVKNLTPPRYRKNQIVSLQNLKEALLSVPAESMYDYQHTWDSFSDSGKLILKSGFDLARDLLSDEDFREVLHRRYNDLYNLANELQVPPENEITHNDQVNNEHKIEPTFGGIAKGVDEVLQRLKIIEQEIRDLKQAIQGLRYYEHRLLIELHRKIDYLVNYNVQLEERKYPNMFYFVNTENFSRRLITNMISGMNATKLHMLCEYRQEMHVVDDQMGCEIMQIDNLAIKCLAPYMKKFMTILTFALKIGAHLAVGMGEMIPDLSREVARLVDTSAIYGAGGAVAAGVVGAAAIGGRNRYIDTRDIQQDQKAAQQWVIDFLRDQNCSSGKDIAEKFGLWRVRYRDNGQIAWICRRHMYMRANEIMEVPI